MVSRIQDTRAVSMLKIALLSRLSRSNREHLKICGGL
jgi:hypothetical protein